MSSQIVIDGQWYEVGQLRQCGPDGDMEQRVLSDSGQLVYTVGDYSSTVSRHNLTPIDTPIWAKLGDGCLKWIRPKYHERLTGDFRIGGSGEIGLDNKGNEISLSMCAEPTFILSPPPEPPKSDEQLLQAALEALYQIRGRDTGDVDPIIGELESRLVNTE